MDNDLTVNKINGDKTKKRDFEEYYNKNCITPKKDIKNVIESYRYKPFNNIESLKVLEVYTSNKIDGSVLTLEQTKEILKGNAQETKLKFQLEVIQLNRSINEHFSIKEDLTIDFICYVHKYITYNTLQDYTWEGKLRKNKVYISNSQLVPPSPEEVSGQLQNAIDIFNKSEKELEDILKFKLEFARILPFMDGNGPVSRLIMNGLLTNAGYPRIIIRDQDKDFYYNLIQEALKDKRDDEWIKFMYIYIKFMCEMDQDVL